MTFKEKLQALRKSKGMSQEQLAACVNVSRQAISKWELGESMPDTTNVIQLSNLFSVSIDYLLKDELEEDLAGQMGSMSVSPEAANWPKARKQGLAMIISGAVMTGIGALGHLTLWVMSTMIKVHVIVERQGPDGKIWYHGGGDVLGYDYGTFIEEYRLGALLLILSIVLIIGIAFLTQGVQKRRSKIAKPGRRV